MDVLLWVFIDVFVYVSGWIAVGRRMKYWARENNRLYNHDSGDQDMASFLLGMAWPLALVFLAIASNPRPTTAEKRERERKAELARAKAERERKQKVKALEEELLTRRGSDTVSLPSRDRLVAGFNEFNYGLYRGEEEIR